MDRSTTAKRSSIFVEYLSLDRCNESMAPSSLCCPMYVFVVRYENLNQYCIASSIVVWQYMLEPLQCQCCMPLQEPQFRACRGIPSLGSNACSASQFCFIFSKCPTPGRSSGERCFGSRGIGSSSTTTYGHQRS